MLYILLYMGATRTQIYLTKAQRQKLDERRRREGKTLAAVIRDAVDAYVNGLDPRTMTAILDATFGAAPNFTVPSRTEWRKRERRIGARRG